ncbi:zinc-binding dehydrogenase [Nocardia miyunensis]|uniref:zinc-binding dehydrogenase n=1 Tax=Nocardia miyunensis TaxID=282684 RepID=UPI000A0025D0|nr:zinc-binding dehydrogenase [Nocardia miyunensis]
MPISVARRAVCWAQPRPLRTDVLGDYAELAAQGRFSIPIAGTFALDDWRSAAQASLSGHAHGKLVLRIG